MSRESHPVNQAMADSGAYQLILEMPARVTVDIGALGPRDFEPGLYVYTGRAVRGLQARLLRHLRKDKRLRWHIDYVLQRAVIGGIVLFPGRAADECSINRRTERAFHARVPVPGFGSSDCRCSAHLLRLVIPDRGTV